MTDSFIRQRRNIFISATILIALSAGQVEIKALSIAGFNLGAFKKPEVFFCGLWLAFFYFTYRFFVYFMEESIEEIKKFWGREFEVAVNPRIETIVRGKFKDPNPAYLFSYAFLRRDKFIYKGQAVQPDKENPERETMQQIEIPISRFKILFWEIKGALRFLVLTPVVTEHILPFLLAVVVLAYCGFICQWSGSFHALFA